VEPGQRALDVGCSPGGLTAVLAEVLGSGNVAAVDPSEPFVETCRARVPGADVRVGVAEHLPFEDARFDAVLSQLVVNFMTDPEVSGLENVSAGELVVGAEYESFDDLPAPFATSVGPSGAFFCSLEPDRREALLRDWHRRLGSPGGSFHLTARAWYAAGTA
jgi:SAM-dependent methyltransferase